MTTAIGDDAQTLQSGEPNDWEESVRGSEVAISDMLKKRFEVKIKIKKKMWKWKNIKPRYFSFFSFLSFPFVFVSV